MLNLYINKLTEKFGAMVGALAEITPNAIIGLLVFGVLFVAAKFVRNFIFSLLEKSSHYRNLAKVASRLVFIVLNIFSLLIASSIIFPSVTPASLFSLLGIGGVAIGFAFKDVFQNFLAGILILLLQSFKVGDQIEVDGVEGTVEDIEIRATVIKTCDNRKVIIPNSSIFTNKLTVNTAYDKRRISIVLGIGYGDDIGFAKNVILETISKIEGILSTPEPYVLTTAFAGSTVDLELRFWIAPPRKYDVLQMRNSVFDALKPALTKAGVDLPFPTQQILFHDQTESTDGQRKWQREGWPSRGDQDPASKLSLQPKPKAPNPI